MQPAKALLPGGGFDAALLLSPEAAIAHYFARAAAPKLVVERIPLDDALGRVLAEDIAADDDYPNASRSAMDGFAVAAASLPAALPLAGEVRMGSVFAGTFAPSTAVRIPTGGEFPRAPTRSFQSRTHASTGTSSIWAPPSPERTSRLARAICEPVRLVLRAGDGLGVRGDGAARNDRHYRGSGVSPAGRLA